MNTALNPPRVPKAATGPPPSSWLPTGGESMAEILALMKRQGMDVTGFEAEAEDIWRHLTEMSDRDPEEYRRFVQAQMEDMKDGATAPSSSSSKVPGFGPPGAKTATSSASSSAAAAAEEEEKFFRPKAGFVVRTTTTFGDGLKVRAEGQGKPLYVNFTAHAAIEPPFDTYYGSVLDLGRAHDLRNADGLQIPLIVGPLRDVHDTSALNYDTHLPAAARHAPTRGGPEPVAALAVDVVLNPAVVKCCTESVHSEAFLPQIVALALEWVTKETGVGMVADVGAYVVLDGVTYAHGRGNDRLTPVLFSVTHAMAQSQRCADEQSAESAMATKPVNKTQQLTLGSSSSGSTSSSGGKKSTALLPGGGEQKKGSGTIQSPASLLSALRDDEARQSRDGARSTGEAAGAHGGGGPAGKKVIIEDCAAVPTAASALLQPPPTTTKAAAPAIKKGFLNTAKAPLYPTGSSEGAGGATGGSLQRVMDKCKVINTRDMSTTEPTPPVKPPAPAPAPASAPATSGSGGKGGGGGGGTGGKRPTDKELDALFSQLDDDFAQADRHLRAMNRARDDEAVAKELGRLSDLLLSPGDKDSPGGVDTANAPTPPAAPLPSPAPAVPLPLPPSAATPALPAAVAVAVDLPPPHPQATVSHNGLPHTSVAVTFGPTGAATVAVAGLASSVYDLSTLCLDVAPHAIKVSFAAPNGSSSSSAGGQPQQAELHVAFTRPLKKDTAHAAVSKKKGTLTVTVDT